MTDTIPRGPIDSPPNIRETENIIVTVDNLRHRGRGGLARRGTARDLRAQFQGPLSRAGLFLDEASMIRRFTDTCKTQPQVLINESSIKSSFKTTRPGSSNGFGLPQIDADVDHHGVVPLEARVPSQEGPIGAFRSRALVALELSPAADGSASARAVPPVPR